jgi:hypothetical protein
MIYVKIFREFDYDPTQFEDEINKYLLEKSGEYIISTHLCVEQFDGSDFLVFMITLKGDEYPKNIRKDPISEIYQ